jgi:hypothetical protein
MKTSTAKTRAKKPTYRPINHLSHLPIEPYLLSKSMPIAAFSVQPQSSFALHGFEQTSRRGEDRQERRN